MSTNKITIKIKKELFLTNNSIKIEKKPILLIK
jgi:hypothetical protein